MPRQDLSLADESKTAPAVQSAARDNNLSTFERDDVCKVRFAAAATWKRFMSDIT